MFPYRFWFVFFPLDIADEIHGPGVQIEAWPLVDMLIQGRACRSTRMARRSSEEVNETI